MWSLKISRLLPIYICYSRETKKTNTATRRPFLNECHWKSIGSYPYIYIYYMYIYISTVPFKLGVDIQSQTKVRVLQTKKFQYGHQVAILKIKSLKINSLLPMTTINMHRKFEIEISKQTWLTLRKPCHILSPETAKSYMTDRRPFWKWCCWKSIDSYQYTYVLDTEVWSWYLKPK